MVFSVTLIVSSFQKKNCEWKLLGHLEMYNLLLEYLEAFEHDNYKENKN